MHYYLKLKAGKSIVNPINRVVITEGAPPTAKPVLFIQNQQNIQTEAGVRTSFYIMMYNSLEDKTAGASEFFSQKIEIPESIVEANSTVQIPEGLTEVNLSEATQQQLYTFLLALPVMVTNEQGLQAPLLDENNQPVLMFGDWGLATM